MAKALVDTVLGEGKARGRRRIHGTDLEHMEYEPLYDFGEADKKAWYVTADNYVTPVRRHRALCISHPHLVKTMRVSAKNTGCRLCRW